jgi:small-conductance mechanosensitive channel
MDLNAYISPETLAQVVKVLIFFLVALPVLMFLRRWIRKVASKHYGDHYGMLIGKVFYYVVIIILVISILVEFGLSLTPILGVGGILGIALGFASQTSVSNVISGFFLIAEKSFEVGDVINIQDTTGVVYSIDTLSVKIRLFDNRFARIPNEMMLKSQVINITRFPIRRLEFKVSVAYKENLERVRDVLVDLANKTLWLFRILLLLSFSTVSTTHQSIFRFTYGAKKRNFFSCAILCTSTSKGDSTKRVSKYHSRIFLFIPALQPIRFPCQCLQKKIKMAPIHPSDGNDRVLHRL